MFVIDSGKHKEKTYDADKKLCLLLPSWVSKASATQRKGAHTLPLPLHSSIIRSSPHMASHAAAYAAARLTATRQ